MEVPGGAARNLLEAMFPYRNACAFDSSTIDVTVCANGVRRDCEVPEAGQVLPSACGSVLGAQWSWTPAMGLREGNVYPKHKTHTHQQQHTTVCPLSVAELLLVALVDACPPAPRRWSSPLPRVAGRFFKLKADHVEPLAFRQQIPAMID